MKRVIGYVISAMLTLFLAFMYNSRELIMVFLAEILLPLILLLAVAYPACRLKISMAIPDSVITRGGTASILVYLDNPTAFLLSRIRIKIKYKNLLLRTEDTFYAEGVVDSRSRVQLSCPIKSELCGKVVFTLASASVYDYLHFFCIPRRFSQREDLAILPRGYETLVEMSRGTRDFVVEGDTFDPEQKGDDPSEIFEIREYRRGDRPQRIHWKLSARSDGLMVKEFSRPIGCPVVVFLDLRHGGGSCQAEHLNAFLELILSISQGLLDCGCFHFLVWYDLVSQRIERVRLQEREDLYGMLESLLQIHVYPEEIPLEAIYREEYPGENYNTGIRMNPGLELYMGEELLIRFHAEKLEKELKEMELVV